MSSHSKWNDENQSELIGAKFNKLTVVKPIGVIFRWGHKHRFFLCKCECGNEKESSIMHLEGGSVKSCGCLHKSMIGNSTRTHGLSKTTEYKSWCHLKDRCYNKKCKKYPIYGARGITVCKRWLHSFENFIADMGNKPSPLHSIDRINVNGNYTPRNCRWATKSEQANNRTNTVYITYKRKKKSLLEWCKLLDLSRIHVHQRIFRRNWTVERAFETPMNTRFNAYSK